LISALMGAEQEVRRFGGIVESALEIWCCGSFEYGSALIQVLRSFWSVNNLKRPSPGKDS
jgi:hypothetical protein